jgi:ligand-binding sensor domain-containing protein
MKRTTALIKTCTVAAATLLLTMSLRLEGFSQQTIAWQPTTGIYGGDVRALAVNPAGHVFAGTFGGGVFRSTNNGNSWVAVNDGLMNPTVRALVVDASGRIFAGTPSGVFRSVGSTRP